MLLSRSWAAKLKGTLQMDMSYATIPIFGVQRRLYRERKLAYMVRSAERPNNDHIYSLDTKIGSSISFTKGGKDNFSSQNTYFIPTQEELEGWWNVSFDGVACKEQAGDGVWVKPP